MRKSISLAFAGGLVSCLLAAGLVVVVASGEAKAWPEAAPRRLLAQSEGQPNLADVQAARRANLNARLSDMIAAGEGPRLREASPSRSRPPVPQQRRQERAQSPERAESSTTQGGDDERYISTITPPAFSATSRTRPSRGSGYTQPVLELKTAPRVPANDVECLTQAIYYEARNESEEGQAAVAEVVINRSKTQGYPTKICEVVYQRNTRTCQFTFTCDGSIGRSPVNMRAWARAERIARDVYSGQPRLLPNSSVNYHANYVRPSWGRRLERVRQIGAHIFYGSPLGGGRTPGAQDAQPQTEPRPLFHRIEALDRAYALMANPGNATAVGAGHDAGL